MIVKTPRTARLPPFYTHGIGSLPRPQVVREDNVIRLLFSA